MANPYDQLLINAVSEATELVVKRISAKDPHICKVDGCSEPRVMQNNGYHRSLCRQHYNQHQNKYYIKKSEREVQQPKALDTRSDRK